ncbi:PhoH family protein [Gammaproteobacteria bacterium]|nr:PhoH family protein [Gammaproteobacteria bacterium]
MDLSLEAITDSATLVLDPENNKQLLNLCGYCDEHIAYIEKRLKLNIKRRGFIFSINGEQFAVKKAFTIITELYKQAQKTKDLSPYQIHLILQSMGETFNMQNTEFSPQNRSMTIKTKNTSITPRGDNQANYIKSIEKYDINFGVGPAGTGKTYLAVAAAVNALENDKVSRIILVRPIVEAGEKLGFLPGDLSQKVDPYLRPLYDALYEMLGYEQVMQLMDRSIIELAPLAYMRGRSLNDAFIILDESQNTTVEQMKMFLTRLGFNSKAIITGDMSQIDLPNKKDSGLIHALEILKNIKEISITHFVPKDIIRHPLVQLVVEAYDNFDNKK